MLKTRELTKIYSIDVSPEKFNLFQVMHPFHLKTVSLIIE